MKQIIIDFMSSMMELERDGFKVAVNYSGHSNSVDCTVMSTLWENTKEFDFCRIVLLNRRTEKGTKARFAEILEEVKEVRDFLGFNEEGEA